MSNQLYNAIIINNDLHRFEIKCSICHRSKSKPYVSEKGTDDFRKEYDLFYKEICNDGFTIFDSNIYCNTCNSQVQHLMDISNKSNRPSKYQYYLNIAKAVSGRSTCLRKHYGSVIVNNDSIISTGYNGAPRNTKNCSDLCECRREKLNIPRGEHYEMCRSVHSEMNAIINASREEMNGATLFLYGYDVRNRCIVEDLDSCQLCKKIIINAGIKNVVFARPNDLYEEVSVSSWIKNDETLTDKFGY